MLDFLAEALAVRRVSVTAVLFLVDVAATATLVGVSLRPSEECSTTYAGVEILLWSAERLLGDELFRNAGAAVTGSYKRRLGNVSRTAALDLVSVRQ